MNDDKEILISDDTEAVVRLFNRIKNIEKLETSNNYDSKIIDFYRKGFLITKGIKMSINVINILGIKRNNIKEYIIDFANNKEPLSNDIQILEIIKFKNTSMFEMFMKKYKDKIKDNVLEFDNEMINYLYSLKWDGKLHNLVPETQEILNQSKY